MKFQLGRLLTSEVLKLRILEIIYKTFYSCHLNTRGKLILLGLDSSELFSIKVGNNIILMSTYIISMYTYITCIVKVFHVYGCQKELMRRKLTLQNLNTKKADREGANS